MVWRRVAAAVLRASVTFKEFRYRANTAALHVRLAGIWAPLVTNDPTPQAPSGAATSSVRSDPVDAVGTGGGKLDGKRLIATEALAQTHGR